jgi:hypothetical protein
MKRHTGGTLVDYNELSRVHQLSLYNSAEVLARGARCFNCEHYVKPNEIVDWVDDYHTAVCPVCLLDTLLPLGLAPVEDVVFLNELRCFYLPALF